MAVDEQARGVARGADEAAGRPASARRSGREIAEMILAKYGVLIAFVVMIIVFSLARRTSFPTWENTKSILTAAAPALVMAGGLTVVLVMQDFDLSFGAMIGLAAGAAVVLMANHGWAGRWRPRRAPARDRRRRRQRLPDRLPRRTLVHHHPGDGHGPDRHRVRAHGQKTIFSGVAAGYTDIGQNTFLGLNNQVWIAAVIAVVLWVLLDRTEIGRYMYAIGGNPEAARLSGIRTRFLRLLGFVIVGLAAAMVGVLISSQRASYTPERRA